jgi:oligogalacturonide lyase
MKRELLRPVVVLSCFTVIPIGGAPMQRDTSCVTWTLDSVEKVGSHRPELLGQPRVIETPIGRALEFDGVDDGLIVPVNPLAGAQAFTIETVFRPDAGGEKAQRFLHVQEVEDHRILIETRLPDAGTWFLDSFIKAGVPEKTLQSRSRTHPLGQWYHAALVYEKGRMRHFIDGVEEMTGDVEYTPMKGGQVSLGVRLNRVFWFKGAMRSVRFCTRALAPDEFERPRGGDAEWIDPATGHRVVRLSREPGSASLYFHQNPYAADGDKMVFTTPSGLAILNLKTREIAPLVDGRVSHLVVGKRTRQAFYMQDGTVFATHLDTRARRAIVKMPELRSGSGLAVNADETLLAGSHVEGAPSAQAAPPRSSQPQTPAAGQGPGPQQESRLEARWAERLPMALHTIDIKSGEVKKIYRSNDWLNHVQFSPTDPALVMYCHEGPWHKVDRIWTIRTDGSGKRLMHARTMEMEIAGHEFFSPDGTIVWYDLQTPKYKVFWLAGVNIATGAQTRYRIQREHWSVHWNTSWNGKLFAGDGGGPRSVAAPGNGQWIYLFTPNGDALDVKRLVDLSKHNYDLEPNVTFTPDDKWIVFRSNMHGASHVYAVEVAPSR